MSAKSASVAAGLAVLLPTKAFGGHEKMLEQILAEALAQGLPCNGIFCRPIPELVQQYTAAGLAPDSTQYAPAQAGNRFSGLLGDALATWRIARSTPKGSTVLFAPGVMQTHLAHIAIALLSGRRVAVYVPMAYKSLEMGFRFPRLRDTVVRSVLKYVDTWITITEQQKRLITEQWGVRGEVYVIPNRLNLPAPASSVNSTCVPERRRLRVLFLGRFDRNQKGLDWLTTTLREHRSSLTGWAEFAFQGKGDFEQEIRRLVDESDDAMVRIAPWGDVIPELSSADVVLLTSRFEGFPLVAVEATHYSVPVLASDKSGLDDVLPPGSVFRFGDTSAMLNALGRMQSSAVRAQAVTYTADKLSQLLSREGFADAVRTVNMAFAEFEA